MTKQLTNKPLVEALLELQWSLKPVGPNALKDPSYPLYVGRLYEKCKNIYQYYEELPTAQIPDELSPYTMKYRFRKHKDGWPLIQVGPGIAAINFTEKYDWKSFLEASKHFYKDLHESYILDNKQLPPKLTSILLRYINAVQISDHVNLFDFLAKQLHTKIVLPREISESDNVSKYPNNFELNVTCLLKVPNAVGSIRFGFGLKNAKPAIIWELQVRSLGENVPQEPSKYETWLAEAHDAIEQWFKTLIKGKLHKQFK